MDTCTYKDLVSNRYVTEHPWGKGRSIQLMMMRQLVMYMEKNEIGSLPYTTE